jgi:N utilization substance protein B
VRAAAVPRAVGRRSKAREYALQMLYQWEIALGSADDVVASYVMLRTTTDRTRDIAERLFRGALGDHESIDREIASAATNWRFDRLAAIERSVLRLAVYELKHERQTPAAVIIDEAVELAKRFGEAASGSFVNGVLDSVCRKMRTADARRPEVRRCARKRGRPGAAHE